MPDHQWKEIYRRAKEAKRSGDIQTAKKLFHDTWNEIENSGETTDNKNCADISHALSVFYFENIKDLDNAEKWARTAISHEETCDRPALLGNHYMFLAKVLEKKGQFDQALAFVDRAIPIYNKVFGLEHPESKYILSVATKLKAVQTKNN